MAFFCVARSGGAAAAAGLSTTTSRQTLAGSAQLRAFATRSRRTRAARKPTDSAPGAATTKISTPAAPNPVRLARTPHPP